MPNAPAWDLAGSFIGGASLAARIAGQRKQQEYENASLEQQASLGSAESVARTGYTPDQLNDPSSGAGSAIQGRMAANAGAENKLHGAQADYFSGRNKAYSDAAAARAGAAASRLGQQGPAAVQKQIADYDKMFTMDPDGSKGIYTPEIAAEHAALMNTFNQSQKIAGAPPTVGPRGVQAPPQPGLLSRGLSSIANFFTGVAPAAASPGSAPPAAAGPSYSARTKDGKMGLNSQTNAWEPIGQ